MVISQLSGGLGNQMFQYAAGRRLALHHGVPHKLDFIQFRSGADERPAGLEEFRRILKIGQLCVTANEASPEEIRRLRDPYSVPSTLGRIVRRIRRFKPGFLYPPSDVRERTYEFEPRILTLPGDAYLEGYWQSWKYFADSEPQIRAEFVPSDPTIAPYARQYLQRLQSLGGPVVALHVRRGDLAKAYEELKNTAGVYGPPVALDYIYTAMKKFDAQARFLIFSDTPKDIQWCRQNIRPDWLAPDRLHFSEGHSDVQDMSLMSACDHNIIANSTFSWWSAWLNPKPQRRVIAPRQWSAPGSGVKISVQDLIPPSWEMI
jgi:Glycosyl transferase family 11